MRTLVKHLIVYSICLSFSGVELAHALLPMVVQNKNNGLLAGTSPSIDIETARKRAQEVGDAVRDSGLAQGDGGDLRYLNSLPGPKKFVVMQGANPNVTQIRFADGYVLNLFLKRDKQTNQVQGVYVMPNPGPINTMFVLVIQLGGGSDQQQQQSAPTPKSQSAPMSVPAFASAPYVTSPLQLDEESAPSALALNTAFSTFQAQSMSLSAPTPLGLTSAPSASDTSRIVPDGFDQQQSRAFQQFLQDIGYKQTNEKITMLVIQQTPQQFASLLSALTPDAPLEQQIKTYDFNSLRNAYYRLEKTHQQALRTYIQETNPYYLQMKTQLELAGFHSDPKKSENVSEIVVREKIERQTHDAINHRTPDMPAMNINLRSQQTMLHKAYIEPSQERLKESIRQNLKNFRKAVRHLFPGKTTITEEGDITEIILYLSA